jgi:RNA polymerase sigma-70 factor (ECF subfamily)
MHDADEHGTPAPPRPPDPGANPGAAPVSAPGTNPGATSDEVDRFVALWESCAHRVHAYATRHVGANAAEEVVAETFLVAWRRLTDVPGDPLPWLIVVARNTIANARRSAYRARTLEAELTRLAEAAAPSATGPEPAVVDRDVMLRGLARLTAVEREALLLIAWDGLTAAQAAAAAGCSTTTFYVRLHRARRRLAGLVDDPPAEGTAESSLLPGTQTPAAPRLSRRSE